MPAPSIRIGILVPSSNTALEPLTTRLLSSLPHVSVHFSRFSVTSIGLSSTQLSQFDPPDAILTAAQLFADAHVDVIGWSGTSAGWLGFDADEKLCSLIEEKFGCKATTSTLALNKLLKAYGATKVGLVTPYLDDVQEAIVKNYVASGIDLSAESHLRVSTNVEIADITEEMLDAQMADVVKAGEGKLQAVTTFCTNLWAAQRVEHWEGEYGVPVLDTVTTVIWDCLKLCAVDAKGLKGWGRMFADI